MTTYRDLSDSERRFEGPNMDEPEPAPETGVVWQAGCEALLTESDMYSVENRFDSNFADIYDSEGDLLFGVPIDIPLNSLRSIITYGKRQFRYGEAAGRRGIQAGLRALLDVPANPTDSEY